MTAITRLTVILALAGMSLALPAQAARDREAPRREIAQAQSGETARIADSVAQCLDNPSRQCALAAALMITAEEELAIERVDTLIALAETFARLGQEQRARTTAKMAREAAQDIGISAGTQQKLAELAPVLGVIGETDEAIATAEALRDRYDIANALGRIALTLAARGEFDAVQTTLERIREPLLALKYAVEATESIVANGATADEIAAAARLLETRIEGVDDTFLQALGYARLAAMRARLGNAEEARRLAGIAEEMGASINTATRMSRLQASLALVDLALGERQSYDNRVARAGDLAARVYSDYDRASAYGDVIPALAAGDHVERSLELAGRVDSIRTLTALLERLSRDSGQMRAVEAIADLVLERATAEDSRFERDRARLIASQALVRIGAAQQAARAIKAIERDDMQAHGLAVLARAL